MELNEKKYGFFRKDTMPGYSNIKMFFFIVSLVFLHIDVKAGEFIRINQLGYLPKSIKVAVYLSDEDHNLYSFAVHNAKNDSVVFQGYPKSVNANDWALKSAYRLDLSKLESTGEYYIKAGSTQSPVFRIDYDVYDGTADYILNYIRQQRCGYNPYLKDSCHTRNNFV